MKVSEVLTKKGKGYKAVMEAELDGLSFTCPVRFETMSSKDVKEQHKVVYRDQTGKEVKRRYMGEARTLTWLCPDNNSPAEGEISAYQVKGEKETPVEPFEKSDTLRVVKLAPRSFKDNFLVERTIEIWSDDQAKLWKLAEYLLSHESVALCPIVMTKGFDTQYLAIIEPRVLDNTKFGFVGFLAKKQIVFSHLLDKDAQAFKDTTKPAGLEILEGVL